MFLPTKILTVISGEPFLIFSFLYAFSGDGLSSSPLVTDTVASASLSSDVELQLLEAAKSGDVNLVRSLVTTHPTVVNCRDVDGRHSTPLHFAAGYNRLAVVEFLLLHNAEVHAKDKGGLVPLHNACSYGHAKVQPRRLFFSFGRF